MQKKKKTLFDLFMIRINTEEGPGRQWQQSKSIGSCLQKSRRLVPWESTVWKCIAMLQRRSWCVWITGKAFGKGQGTPDDWWNVYVTRKFRWCPETWTDLFEWVFQSLRIIGISVSDECFRFSLLFFFFSSHGCWTKQQNRRTESTRNDWSCVFDKSTKSIEYIRKNRWIDKIHQKCRKAFFKKSIDMQKVNTILR